MDYVAIGAEIRKRRKKRGLSQEKLGELAGLSQKQISKIETGGTDSLWKLKKIADVFGVTILDLIEQDAEQAVEQRLSRRLCA